MINPKQNLRRRAPELARDAWRGEGVAKGDGIWDGRGGVNATWCEIGARGRSGLRRQGDIPYRDEQGRDPWHFYPQQTMKAQQHSASGTNRVEIRGSCNLCIAMH